MDSFLYYILILLPLPLLIILIKRNHYSYCLPPFVAFLGIYIFNIIGSLEVIKNNNLFSWRYYFSLLTIILMFYLFYLFIFIFGKKLYINWRRLNIKAGYSQNIGAILLLFWAFSIFMFYVYYKKNGLPAIFNISLFDYNDIYKIRAAKSTNLAEGMHWYRLAFSTIPSFIFVYTFILMRLKSSRKLKAIFFLNLPIVLFFSSLTLHKKPFAYLILYMLIIEFSINKRKIGFKKLFIYFIGIFGCIAMMLRIYLLNRDIVEVITILPKYFYNRICVAYTVAHAHILSIFPEKHDFFYGATLGNPGQIFPYSPVNLSQFLEYWVYGRLGNYSSPSFSQGYANFGLTGIIVIVLVMFLQIIMLQIIFKKCPQNSLFLSIYVLIIPKMLEYSHTSIQGAIGNIFILFAIMTIFLVYVSNDFLKYLGDSNNLISRANCNYGIGNNQ